VTLESFLAHRATGVAESETAISGVGRVVWRHWGEARSATYVPRPISAEFMVSVT
jgi:hypothetical protein